MAARGRSVMINGGRHSQRVYGRLIPKRGQVKLGIVLGLAHTVASIFSPRKKFGVQLDLFQRKKERTMEGARRLMILNGGKVSRGFASRPIPKRGQLKVAIVLGLAHCFASFFSHSTSRRAACHFY
ncbi:hypothetical protein SADUNF_Sadunf11G0025900 [Salix dunnii]|uniref:Uncharacterized protein n=1 Tax=Salix dunnii TaxID=1413687 RepID=A0A835MQ35_9ROSI|nr:hypothetical protein SADUNF_Sadunf11G0025900 [Salix dunnii]